MPLCRPLENGWEVRTDLPTKRTARELLCLYREHGKELPMVLEMHPAVWGSAGTTRASAEALLAGLGLRAVPLTGQKDPLVEYGQVLLERV